MTINYAGNAVAITFSAGDPITPITLADGYSVEEMIITMDTGIYGISNYVNISANPCVLRFPPVNSRHPNTFTIIFDNTQDQRFSFIISKFGQIPDPHYFEAAFNPILVTGDDGNEYKVIPSNQFK